MRHGLLNNWLKIQNSKHGTETQNHKFHSLCIVRNFFFFFILILQRQIGMYYWKLHQTEDHIGNYHICKTVRTNVQNKKMSTDNRNVTIHQWRKKYMQRKEQKENHDSFTNRSETTPTKWAKMSHDSFTHSWNHTTKKAKPQSCQFQSFVKPHDLPKFMKSHNEKS